MKLIAREEQDIPKSSRGKFPLILRIGVALVLIVLILQWIDLRETVKTIGHSDWRYIILILVLAFCDRYLMAYKWATLLRARGIAISVGEAFRIYLLSGFVGAFLPTSIGADVVKLARTTLAKGEIEKVAASILMERTVGLFALTTLAVGGLAVLVRAGKIQFLPLFYLVTVLFAFVILVLGLALRDDVLAWLDAKLARARKYKIIALLLKLHLAYVQLGKHRKVLGWFFLLSLIEYGILSLMNFCGAVALHIPVTFVYFLVVIPVTLMVAALPISIGGIGVMEGSYILLFSLAGLSREESFALALYMRALGLVALTPGAAIFLVEAIRVRRVRG